MQAPASRQIAINQDWYASRKTAAFLLEQGLIEESNEVVPGWPPLTVKRYVVPPPLREE